MDNEAANELVWTLKEMNEVLRGIREELHALKEITEASARGRTEKAGSPF